MRLLVAFDGDVGAWGLASSTGRRCYGSTTETDEVGGLHKVYCYECWTHVRLWICSDLF